MEEMSTGSSLPKSGTVRELQWNITKLTHCTVMCCWTVCSDLSASTLNDLSQ